MLGTAAGAVVGGGGGTTALVLVGAGAAGAAVLRGFAFTFVAAAGAGVVDVAATVAEATADARAEELAIGEVLPVGVAFQPPVASPIIASTAKPAMATPTLCSFFIDGPLYGPPPLA